MLGSPYFTDLFLTKSSARPRLLFAVELDEDGDDWWFLTSPQLQNPYEKSSSLVATADFHMNFIGDRTWLDFCGHASGLVCFRRHSTISEEDKPIVICKPSTGQFASLPLPKGRLKSSWRSFLGYNPIDKQIKVLSITYSSYQILTLESGNDSWRKIHCPLNHSPCFHVGGICINGVLYYFAKQIDLPSLIVCFDVRSEKFTFIYRDFIRDFARSTLINYKGQLGVISLEYNCIPGSPCSLTFYMWVIKDVGKPIPEWSEYVFNFWENQAVYSDVSTSWEDQFFRGSVSVVGVTGSGEIVLSMDNIYTSKPYYVFYINPERNTVQGVEIKGFETADHGAFGKRGRRVRVFIDHIEDLKFIKTTYAATSKRPPEQKRKPTATSTSSKPQLQQDGRAFESINKFDSLRLLDDDDEFT